MAEAEAKKLEYDEKNIHEEKQNNVETKSEFDCKEKFKQFETEDTREQKYETKQNEHISEKSIVNDQVQKKSTEIYRKYCFLLILIVFLTFVIAILAACLSVVLSVLSKLK